MKYGKSVRIVEVGPRDGLQNEKTMVPTFLKISFVQRLVDAGLPLVEAASFVRPNIIPQMSDALDVLGALENLKSLTALVPNLKGLEKALDVGLCEVAVFTAVSETFNKKNINTSVAGSLEKLGPVIDMAKQNNLRVRGYISTVFGCPYEGETSQDILKYLLQQFYDRGVYECVLGDTIGAANPLQVQSLVEWLDKNFNLKRVAMHFHDTKGMALANIFAAFQGGVTTFDSSAGGLGGCPYAPGASGNVATEDVVSLFESMGIETGVDLNKVAIASKEILTFLGKSSLSKAHHFLIGQS